MAERTSGRSHTAPSPLEAFIGRHLGLRGLRGEQVAALAGTTRTLALGNGFYAALVGISLFGHVHTPTLSLWVLGVCLANLWLLQDRAPWHRRSADTPDVNGALARTLIWCGVSGTLWGGLGASVLATLPGQQQILVALTIGAQAAAAALWFSPIFVVGIGYLFASLVPAAASLAQSEPFISMAAVAIVAVYALLQFPLCQRVFGRLTAGARALAERETLQEALAAARDDLEREVSLRTAELRASRDELRLLTDHLPIAIGYVDAQLRVRFANRVMCSWYARTREHMEGARSDDIIGPAVRSAISPYRQRALAGESVNLELTIDFPDTVQRLVTLSYVPDLTSAGSVRGYYVLMLDQTQRRRDEALLRDTALLLESVVNTAPQSIYVKNRDRRYRLVNRAFAAFLGRRPEELIGKRLEDLEMLPAAVVERQIAADQRVWEEDRAIVVEDDEFIDAAGIRHVQRIHKLPLHDSTGETTGLVGICEDITEHRQLERRLAGILDLAVDAIISVDAEQRIILFNQGAATMFGYAPEEAIGKPLGMLIPHRFAEQHARHVEQFGQEGPPARLMSSRGELFGLRRNGEEFPLEASISKLNLAGSTVYTVIGRDIAERKLAAKRQRESEAIFRNVVDHLPSMILLKDLQGRFLLANRKFLAFYGLNMAEIVGKNSFDLNPREVAEQITQQDREVISQGRAVERLQEYPRTDGSRWLLTTKFPVRSEDGAMQAIGTIVTDVTEARRIEAELAASELRFRGIFENVPSAILLKDLDGRFVAVNPVAKGWMANRDLRGLKADQIFPPETARIVETQDERVLRTGQVAHGELEMPQPNGDLLRLEVTRFPVRNAGGEIMGIGVIGTDVSERLQLEQQLRQSQKMEALGHLAGGVAHDFNNLLLLMIGYTQMTLRRSDLPPEMEEELKEVLHAGKRAADLVRNLLGFSRKQQLRLELLKLDDLVERHAGVMRRLIGEHIAVSVHTGDTVSVVKADPGAIEQVLLNVCINARDAMPEGGTLTIALEPFAADAVFCQSHRWAQPVPYARIDVTDTGTGIVPEIRERIFDPFVTTKEAGKGSGLGLAQAYGIIKQHQGHIEFRTESGKGTTFSIFLPASDGTPPSEAAEDALPQRGNGETILVAEDERHVRTLLEELLTRQGYRVLPAGDGLEALTLIEAHAGAIDLAILDVVMPGMGGKAAFLRLRTSQANLPVLFSTGYDAGMIDDVTLSDPLVSVIRKPYEANGLYRAVHQALQSSRRRSGHSA